MTSIVETWINRAKEKHDSKSAAIRHANLVCNQSMGLSSVNAMRDGKRNVPVCVHRYMLNEVLLTAMENAGFDTSKGDFEKLRDSLSLPKRVK